MAAEDVLAAVSFMRDRYGVLPVILIGFSFGGPAVWAAAQRCDVHGLIALASSARGGERFEEAGLDTAAGVKSVVYRSMPVLWLHGLADRNVDPAVTAHFSALAQEHQGAGVVPSNLTVCMVRACSHMFDTSRILAYEVVRAWLSSVFGGPPLPKLLGMEPGRCRWLLSSRAGSCRAEVLELPEISRGQLRKKSTKGYSE